MDLNKFILRKVLLNQKIINETKKFGEKDVCFSPTVKFSSSHSNDDLYDLEKYNN